MDTTNMISAIDEEIDRLQQIRSLLSHEHRGPGRPRNMMKKATLTATTPKATQSNRGHHSPESRKRLSKAMKARWRAARKAGTTPMGLVKKKAA